MKRQILLILLAVIVSSHADLRALPSGEKPKVRAITAFISISRSDYRRPVAEAVTMLGQARAMLEQAGYEVQSVRIATQPFSETIRGLSDDDVRTFYKEYAQIVREANVNASIGPAMFAPDADVHEAELLADVLAANPALSGSLTVADGHGVRWGAVHAAARVMKHLQNRSPDGQANFNFAATALVPSFTPFFPAAYHTGAGKRFSVGLQSANVVIDAFAAAKSLADASGELTARLAVHAQAIERAASLIEAETGWTYEGIDLSPAPFKEFSVGAAIEKLTGSAVGAPGTMSAAAVTTATLQAVPVKQAGFSGLMLPVLEDVVLAERWSQGVLTLDALLAYSAVCGTGLDTVPLPGDVTAGQLGRIIGDMASLAVKWNKPLSARLMPVRGKKAGERSTFDNPFLVNAIVQPIP